MAIAAAIVAILGGALGGYHFMQYSDADAVRRQANEARRRVDGAINTARGEGELQRRPNAKQEQDIDEALRVAEVRRRVEEGAKRTAEQKKAPDVQLTEELAKAREEARRAQERAAEAERLFEAAE